MKFAACWIHECPRGFRCRWAFPRAALVRAELRAWSVLPGGADSPRDPFLCHRPCCHPSCPRLLWTARPRHGPAADLSRATADFVGCRHSSAAAESGSSEGSGDSAASRRSAARASFFACLISRFSRNACSRARLTADCGLRRPISGPLSTERSTPRRTRSSLLPSTLLSARRHAAARICRACRCDDGPADAIDLAEAKRWLMSHFS